MLSSLQTQQHRVTPLTIPDTPPGLVSPSSSTYSSIPSEGPSPWRSRSNGPLSPPMYSYGQPHHSTYAGEMGTIGTGFDDGQARKTPPCQEPSGGAASGAGSARRMQLPPLSSLFPANMRSLPSPALDRPSPYSATSPLDAPRSAGGYLERSGSTSSYFSHTGRSSFSSTAHHTRTLYEPKVYDRGAPPPPRTAFPGPLSPGFREPSQAHRRGSSNRWSYHQDMSRSGEYVFDGRERPPTYPTQQVAGQKHQREEYLVSREYHSDPRAQQYQPPHQQQPAPYFHQLQQQQQARGSVTGETMPTKDGLGPKIWTGTHFLPRFVRAAEIPGEGLCYFYDDGSHCKTTIDGEVVNAHWGVTKAGKPRKRLAIACITCREKKIKCDPDYPRCVQCEKFGRICKFKNAPRGGGHHNTSPTSESGEPESTQHRVQPHEYAQTARHSPSVSPRTTMPALTLAVPPKRVKYEPAYHSAEQPRDRSHNASWPMHHQERQQQQPHQQTQGLAGQLPLPGIHDDVFRPQRWRNDPYSPDSRPQAIHRRSDGARA